MNDPILVAKMQAAQAQEAVRECMERVGPLLTGGTGMAFMIINAGDDHTNDSLWATCNMERVVESVMSLARRQGVAIAAQKQDTVLQAAVVDVHEGLTRLEGKVRRALMFLPGNQTAAIVALRQALGVEDPRPDPSLDGWELIEAVLRQERHVRADDTEIVEAVHTVMNTIDAEAQAREDGAIDLELFTEALRISTAVAVAGLIKENRRLRGALVQSREAGEA
jgi:hypothetical protein